MSMFSTLIPRPFRDRLIAAATPVPPYGAPSRVQAIGQVVAGAAA